MNKTSHSRKLQSGKWYWVSKVVVQEYAPLLGVHALGVYHFLASMVDANQCCYPSQKYIAERLGCARSTVSKSIRKLEKLHLINVVRRSRYHNIYQLLDTKDTRKETQKSVTQHSDVSHIDRNKNQLTRSNNNNVSKLKKRTENILTKNIFQPETKEELLALDIAESLNDYERISLYLSYAHKYPESLLRQTLSEVTQTPAEKIKKSRGAFFIYLIKQYAQKWK